MARTLRIEGNEPSDAESFNKQRLTFVRVLNLCVMIHNDSEKYFETEIVLSYLREPSNRSLNLLYALDIETESTPDMEESESYLSELFPGHSRLRAQLSRILMDIFSISTLLNLCFREL